MNQEINANSRKNSFVKKEKNLEIKQLQREIKKSIDKAITIGTPVGSPNK